MNALLLNRFGSLSRVAALWTSAATVALLTLTFATDHNLTSSIQESWAIGEVYTIVTTYLALVLAMVIGYLIANNRKLAELGGTIVVVSFTALYFWCQSEFNLTLSPVVFALAAPAVFHLASVVLFRTAEQNQPALQTTTQAASEVPAPCTEDDPSHGEKEFVAGAA